MKKYVIKKWIKILIATLVAIALAVITFLVNTAYIKKHTEKMPVVVAGTKISAYSRVDPQSLKIRQVVKAEVPADAVTGIEYFNTPYYTLDLGFGEGDIIRKGRLTEKDKNPFGKVLDLQEEGKVLASVNTDLVRSTSNLVTPGVLVNIVVYQKGEMGQPPRIITPAEDHRLGGVLVVDKKNSESTYPAEKGREAIPAVLTFETTPDTGAALVLYQETGKVYCLPMGLDVDSFLRQNAKWS